MSEHTIKGSDVINYLNANPDFFVKYPDLLQGLKVSDGKAQLTSLVQHQVQVLQKKNTELNQKFHVLISNAKNSEQLMDKLFQLLCELAVAPQSDFVSHYQKFIRLHFSTSHFALFLTADFLQTKDDEVILDVQKIRPHFDVFNESDAPVSGRLKKDKLKAVFADDYADVKSAVALPIGPQACHGIMVFGSEDEDKFNPESSTDILQKLSLILSNYLALRIEDHEHKAVG